MGAKNNLTSPAMQDYLEAILELSEAVGDVRVTDLAVKLGVAKASVSQAVSNLINLELVIQERYGPIILTDKGYEQARRIQRRHQVLRCFLINVLNVEEGVAERDACLMEHAISPITMEKLCEFLESKGLLLGL
jgi:DtxR family Mn-dependent transcriptional regulator